VLTIVAGFTASAQTFHNPLHTTGPDPFMVYFGGSYYLTYTTNPAENSGGNGIEIVKARSIAELFDQKSKKIWSDNHEDRSNNMWAPELHRLKVSDGYRWYLYYTAGTAACCNEQRIHVLESESDDPIGPYSYKGQLTKGYAIDGHLFSVADDLYFVYCGVNDGNHIYIAKMGNPYTLIEPAVKISSPVFSWEKMAGVVNEAPATLIRNGKIFLTYSYNDCSSDYYGLGMLVANATDNLLDRNSWKKSGSPAFQKSDINDVFGPGHNGFFKSPDGKEDWLIYHANSSPNAGCSGNRNPRAQMIQWNADGTPDLGTPLPLSAELRLPSGDPGAANIVRSSAYVENENTFLRVYPNPAKDILHFDYSSEKNESVVMQLLYANGQVASEIGSRYTMKGVVLKETVDISNLPLGIYVIKLVSPSVSKNIKVAIR
jgi:GH43 family beta-xylosidase